jgi:hypothetical protein
MPNDLEEALLAAAAAPLIQKEIDPVLLEYMRRYSPVVRAIPTVKWGSTSYYFNQRTNLPAGGNVTDGGARPVATSTYVQNNFDIKLFQTVGAVTGYAEAVTADLIGSLLAKEMQGAHQGLLWDIENEILWGHSGSTLNGAYPEFSGLDELFAQFSGDTQNAINFSDAAFDLGVLDQLIDMVEQNVAMPVETNDWMFIASPTLNSRISQLLTNQQRFVDTVEIEPGLIVNSYRNVPIVKSSFLSPRSDVLGAVTTTGNTGTGSGFTGGNTFNYRVSTIQARYGEIQASASVSVSVNTTGNNVVLTVPSFTGPDNGTPVLYKVYRTVVGGAAGTETYLGPVDASVLSSNGNVYSTDTITDTGTSLQPSNSGGYTAVVAAPNYAYNSTTGVYGNAGLLPLGSGDQNVYLLSRDPDFIVRPYVRDLTPVDLYPTTASPDSLPFAIVSDTTLAVRALKYAGRGANVNIALS